MRWLDIIRLIILFVYFATTTLKTPVIWQDILECTWERNHSNALIAIIVQLKNTMLFLMKQSDTREWRKLTSSNIAVLIRYPLVAEWCDAQPFIGVVIHNIFGRSSNQVYSVPSITSFCSVPSGLLSVRPTTLIFLSLIVCGSTDSSSWLLCILFSKVFTFCIHDIFNILQAT